MDGPVRRRTWAALAFLAAGVVLALVGRAVEGARALDALAGLLLVAALGLGASLLRFWTRLVPPVPNLRPLFPSVGPQERWCPACGRSAPRTGTCPSCGRPAPRRRRVLQRKPSPLRQERK